jgi:hypothetical protein
MRILLIGNADSSWIKKYAEEVLLPAKHNVAILSFDNTNYNEFYKENFINIFTISARMSLSMISDSIPQKKYISRLYDIVKYLIPKSLRNFLWYFRIRRSIAKIIHNVDDFNAVHFHFIDYYAEYIYSDLLKHFTGKIIMTYWGSDLFLGHTRRHNQTLLRKASAVIFTGKNLMVRFRSLYGCKYDAKLHVLNFGASAFDIIDNHRTNLWHDQNRQHFGIPDGKVSIMAGYNANPHQQHISIINAISALPENIVQNIHLMLQYSYGKVDDPEYYKNIQNTLESLTCSWSIIYDYLDDFQTARLRNSVDIFINAQKTDALSSSMMEYLYADTIVLNGAWLEYPELDGHAICALKFNNFKDLIIILEDLVLNISVKKNIYPTDYEYLSSMKTWKAVKPKWLEFYE